jgi:hypothetical protein
MFLYGTSAHRRGNKSLPLVYIFSQMSQFHVLLLFVSRIQFNIILIYSHIFEVACFVRPSNPTFIFISVPSHVRCIYRSCHRP